MKPALIRLRLTRPHQIDLHVHQPGAILELSAPSAAWLIEQGAAQRVEPGYSGPERPDLELPESESASSSTSTPMI